MNFVIRGILYKMTRGLLCEIGGGEMKYQILESEKGSYTRGKEFAVYDCTNREYICVTFSKDMAITIKEALEKQVIMKPEESIYVDRCPKCKRFLTWKNFPITGYRMKQNFCSYCGQKLEIES